MPVATREVQLVRRPQGTPVPADFRLVSLQRPEPEPGQILVRNLAMSVDPYMRGRMAEGPSYAPAWELGETMRGGTVGVVEASMDESRPVGAIVVHDHGWRDLAVFDAAEAAVVEALPGLPLSAHLGALGMPGLTAWAGLVDVAGFRPDDVVFVSGAAGAVGSMVGQVARLKGASAVVGSAGSAAKVAWLTDELGFDAAFDYHDGPVAGLLRNAAPDGIDVFFDNVGGEHLEAAIRSLRPFGRAALCGAISQYNLTSPAPGPTNLVLLVGKRLTLRGFIVSDHAERRREFVDEVGGWIRSGQLVARETVVDGLDHAVDAFLDLLGGANTGKMIVRLHPDPA